MKRAFIIAIVLSVVSSLAYGADDKAADALITKGLELRREGRALDAIRPLSEGRRHRADPAQLRSARARGIGRRTLERRGRTPQRRPGLPPRPVGEEEPQFARPGAHPRRYAHWADSASGPACAAIVVSDKSVGSLPLGKPVRVNSGPAIVTATAQGFRQFEIDCPAAGPHRRRSERDVGWLGRGNQRQRLDE